MRQYKLIKIYIFAHATTYTYINLKSKSVQMIILQGLALTLKDNTSKSGFDFDGEKKEAVSYRDISDKLDLPKIGADLFLLVHVG